MMITTNKGTRSYVQDYAKRSDKEQKPVGGLKELKSGRPEGK